MKRTIVCLLLSLAVCLAGCAGSAQETPATTETDFMQGMWVSYSDLAALGATGDFAGGFETLCHGARELGLQTLFVHTTAFADSLFDSSVYPRRGWSEGLDCVAIMVETAHRYGLRVHAWINPYRISTDPQAPLVSPLAETLGDGDVCRCEAGTYLNPASETARRTVVNGAKELLDGYAFDGLHLDDYFYPTADESFDRAAYDAYCAACRKPLPLGDWRRTCTSVLVADLAALAHSRGTVLTVSPCAFLSRNRETLYADVVGWCRSGYLDGVIPQVYFGFDHPDESCAFDRLVTEWIRALSGTRTRLYIGMAAYKLGSTQTADREEWQNGTDLLARELLYLYAQPTVQGAVYFSYSALFADTDAHTAQRSNLYQVIKKGRERL